MLIDNHEELRAQYTPDGSDLRRAQLRMLEMLKFIKNVCENNGITYWIDGGTLLGAARHDGFIPWDDDTDICMPREDYLRFKQYMLNDNKNEDFVLQCHQTDPNYYGTWGVLRDLRSKYVKKSARLNNYKYQGLQVDIFPIDSKSSNIFYWKLCRWVFAYLIHAPLHEGRLTKYLRFNVGPAFIFLTKVMIPLCRLFTRSGSYVYSHQYGTFWHYKWGKDMLFPNRVIMFEGVSFPAPCDVDSYLTSIYGNWRKVPNLKDRFNHKAKFSFID